MLDIFFETKFPTFDGDKRHIMIFHCEFSSERGPRMYTIMRQHDRSKNVYPKLHWPEIYLLKGRVTIIFYRPNQHGIFI